MIDLQAIQERKDAATGGPWEADGGNVYAESYASEYNIKGCVACCVPSEDEMPLLDEANAIFIASAPTDIAALIDEVKRLRAALDELSEKGSWVVIDDEFSCHGWVRDCPNAMALIRGTRVHLKERQ